MRTNKLAKRYALGLLKTIENEQEYHTVKNELESFLQLLQADDNFKAGMESLLFSKKQKNELLDSIHNKTGFNPKTHKFLQLMVDENRLMYLDMVLHMFEELWFENKGIETFTVFSAIPLNEKLEQKLIKHLKGALKKEIRIEKEIDKSLIAGIKLQRGSIFYDYSINGNLKKLKNAMLSETSSSAGTSEEIAGGRES